MRLVVFALLLALGACAAQTPVAPQLPVHAVIGVDAFQLNPDYWINRAGSPQRVILSDTQIKAQNDRLQTSDPTVRDLSKIPPQLSAAEVRQWIGKLSVLPDDPLFDEQGKAIAPARLKDIE